MSESRCRLIGGRQDELQQALDESRSVAGALDPFYVQKLDDGESWLLELAADPLTVGRSDTADLTLADATVSGRHARLERHAGGLFIKDLRSTNGTYVNERRVLSQPLADGDVVRCGGIRLRIVLQGVPQPLARTVASQDSTRIPVRPDQLIEIHQSQGSLSGPARQALVNAADRVAKRSPPYLIVDLSQTVAVSGNALALIGDLRERLRGQSGEMVLCAMSPRVRDSFDLSPQASALNDAVYTDLVSARKALVRMLSRHGLAP
jgi:pSer/pThr/pTyr-binding forkhead associated (FHA) protein